VFIKIHDLIIDNLNAFAFEQLLHNGGGAEVLFASEQAISVDYPVSRDILFG
jgi:hypothetical protein